MMSSKLNQTHESLNEKAPVKIGSDRSFGLVFATFFLISGCLSKKHSLLFIILGSLFLAVALVFPMVLKPLNKIWFHIGLGLSKITNPIIMFILFYVIFVPFGLILKMMGSTLFSIRPQANLKTYWKDTSNEPMHSPKRQY